jgi:hypothetical protein
MSSIPNTAMKHAQAHDGEQDQAAQGAPTDQGHGSDGAKNSATTQPAAGANAKNCTDGAERGKLFGGKADTLIADATRSVKERPGVAAAIGAAVLAGAAAIAGGPAIAKAIKGDDAKKAGKKKKPAKPKKA